MKAEGDTITLHQSDLKNFLSCADQFRVTNGVLPGGDIDPDVDIRIETDAATLGTVFHSIVERDIVDPYKSLVGMQRSAKASLGNVILEYTTSGVIYRTESFGADGTRLLAKLADLCEMWWHYPERKLLQDLASQKGAIELEWHFDTEFITGREGKYSNIRIAGTADVLDRYGNRLIDWKTSGRQFQRWEKQRFDPQPTVYTFAAAQLKEIEEHGEGYRFDYRVFSTKSKQAPVDEITVWRRHGQWSWLVEQITHMVELIESDLTRWPLNDGHALCSPKWCPLWDSCKGQYVSEKDWS
jgi:hypothetical protein